MVVLFDIDETLLDHRTTERAAATALHRIARVRRPLGDFVAAWSEALERNFRRYLAGELSYEDQRRARVREVVDPELGDEAADRLLARYLDAYLAGSALFPDVLPCLDRLAGGRHRLGIISNGQSDHQRTKLARCGIAERFECILISEECGHHKPAPEIFAEACARMGEPAARAVYVGDRYDVDAEGARRAGLHGIWLDRGARAGAEHEPPHHLEPRRAGRAAHPASHAHAETHHFLLSVSFPGPSALSFERPISPCRTPSSEML